MGYYVRALVEPWEDRPPSDLRYCIDVFTQINSIQAARSRLLDDHARHCVRGGEQEDTADELMAAVARLTRRG